MAVICFVCNKLECVSLSAPSTIIYICRKAYLTLSVAPLYGRLLALPIDTRLGWKGLPGTNTLAYYGNSQLTSVKSFITLAPGQADLQHVRQKSRRDHQFPGTDGGHVRHVQRNAGRQPQRDLQSVKTHFHERNLLRK